MDLDNKKSYCICDKCKNQAICKYSDNYKIIIAVFENIDIKDFIPMRGSYPFTLKLDCDYFERW